MDKKLITINPNDIREMTFEEVKTQFNKLIFKSISSWKGKYDFEELTDIATIGLFKAYKFYDVKKGFNFITYAVRIINNELLMFNRSESKQLNNVSLNEAKRNNEENLTYEECLADETDYEEEAINNIMNEHLYEMLNVLGERSKNVLIDYFIKDIKQNELAAKYNVKQSVISRIISQSTKKIRRIYRM